MTYVRREIAFKDANFTVERRVGRREGECFVEEYFLLAISSLEVRVEGKLNHDRVQIESNGAICIASLGESIAGSLEKD